MKPPLARSLPLLAIVGVGIILATRKTQQDTISTAASAPVSTEPAPPSPPLLPARKATPDEPAYSWERLLASDGTPAEDRSAVEDIVTNYLQSAPHATRAPLGTNEEITRALTDRDTLGDSALPTSHPAIVSGLLVDRWGAPWHFHQLAADIIEVRSAGPDRRLYTRDDLVK